MSRPTFRSAYALSVLPVLFCLMSGCSDDSAPRSSVTVESINNGETLDSDVYNNGPDDLPGTGDDYIVEDQVPVVLRNLPHDSGLDINANGPFGAVVFDRYEVRFEGDETLAPLFGSWYLRVPSGSAATGEVTVVPASYKMVPPLSTLAGEQSELLFTAKILLIGVEEDSQDEVIVEVGLPVNAANWGDD